MRTMIAAGILWLVASMPGWAEESPARRAAEEAVLARLEAMKTAAENLDAEGLFRFVSADAPAPIAQDGVLFTTREEALASSRSGFQDVASVSYQFDHQSVTFLSPESALVVARGSTSVTLKDGRSFTVPSAQTTILTLQDGEWIVIHSHRSSPSR